MKNLDHEKELKLLRKHEQRLRLALKGANDGLWDWNLGTNEVYYSPRWKSMLGYEEHELESSIETWKNLVHPQDKERALQQVSDYISSNANSFEVEMRMRHKNGTYRVILSRAFFKTKETESEHKRLIGTHVDITERKKAEDLNKWTAKILEMIALGKPAPHVYDAIARMYEARHQGLRCSLLELENGILLHGGAPSLPEAYAQAVHGLKNGPEVGSCGTSTYTGKRCVVEDIATDPKWKNIKQYALPHGMRCCWSEPIKNSRGVVLGAFGMYFDFPAKPNNDQIKDLESAARLAGIVMERDKDQKHIYQLAYIDSVTGLASRAHFYQHAEELIETAKRYQRNLNFLYIDLDNFKNINDSLGHDQGDELLKEVANRLRSNCRKSDFVARLSGDEFCVVIEQQSDSSCTSTLAKNYLKVMSQPFTLAQRKHSITCSIGISSFPNDGSTIKQLLKTADTALYAAKNKGKNRYAFYQKELTQQAEYRMQFEQYLRYAIIHNQITLAYQPIVHAETLETVAVEVLSRWHHPKLGEVSPFEFIDVAERIGMVKQLTQWVLLNACEQIVKWQKSGLPNLQLSVNISPNHFLDQSLIELVKEVISITGITAESIKLEVTESVVQTSTENLTIFKTLKEMGLEIAIDDFGTGYSSLASLKHISVDYLKIDKSFTDHIVKQKASKNLMTSIIDMGHNLDYKVIVEGVEKSEQLELVRDLKGDYVQGNYICAALPAEKLAEYFQI